MAIVVSESKNSAYLLYQIEKQAFYLETWLLLSFLGSRLYEQDSVK